MRTFAQKQKVTQHTTSAKSPISSWARFGQNREVTSLLHLQRAIGNQAVQRLLQAKPDGLEGVSDATASGRFGHGFSRIPVHAKASVRIQSKLAVNPQGNIYEEEADRVSEQMMQMPEPQLQRACPCGGACPKCQTKQLGQEHDRLQTKRVQASVMGQIAAPPIVHQVVRSPGQPLDPAIRPFFERRFGHDFSRVRVHTDARAAESARAVNAVAYTVGQDLVFSHGQYEPGRPDGKKLLAHELTHVVQQSKASQRADVVQRQPSGSRPPAPSSSPASATVFHPGVNHGHTPSGRWADVQANPNSGFWENRVCANFPPNTVVGAAIYWEFDGKPLALDHLNWYLGNGQGADYVEDTNLDRLLRTDTGVQALLAGLIPSSAPASGRFTSHVKVEQSHYQNQDFRYAFGAIDRLDFEVDFTAGTVHAWFQDRYEWHPVYPGLYTAFPDDVVRETNCVHAALVELKSGGARDFWMKGEATVPLSVFRRAPAGSGGGGWRGGGGSL